MANKLIKLGAFSEDVKVSIGEKNLSGNVHIGPVFERENKASKINTSDGEYLIVRIMLPSGGPKGVVFHVIRGYGIRNSDGIFFIGKPAENFEAWTDDHDHCIGVSARLGPAQARIKKYYLDAQRKLNESESAKPKEEVLKDVEVQQEGTEARVGKGSRLKHS